MRKNGEGDVGNQELDVCCWIEIIQSHYSDTFSSHYIALSRGHGPLTELLAKLRNRVYKQSLSECPAPESGDNLVMARASLGLQLLLTNSQIYHEARGIAFRPLVFPFWSFLGRSAFAYTNSVTGRIFIIRRIYTDYRTPKKSFKSAEISWV